MTELANNVSIESAAIRHDWTREQVLAIMQQPMNDLLFQAQTVHRQFHDPNAVQISQLLSIKTRNQHRSCALVGYVA